MRPPLSDRTKETVVLLRAITGFAVMSTLLFAPAAFSLTITLVEFQSVVYAQAGGFGFDSSSPVAVPEAGSLTATEGENAATTGYSLSVSKFEITFDHSRAAAEFSQAQSYAGFNFILDEDVDYALDGLYAAVDAEGRRIFLAVGLIDVTASSTLLQSSQESNSTPNESFAVGLEEGEISALVGSLTGSLVAGHEYQFSVQSLLYADDSASSAATASGSVTLTFVPEPSTTVLIALGLVGLVFRGRGVSLT